MRMILSIQSMTSMTTTTTTTTMSTFAAKCRHAGSLRKQGVWHQSTLQESPIDWLMASRRGRNIFWAIKDFLEDPKRRKNWTKNIFSFLFGKIRTLSGHLVSKMIAASATELWTLRTCQKLGFFFPLLLNCDFHCRGCYSERVAFIDSGSREND